MEISKQDIIKEPWLKSFTENVNITKVLSDEEENEVNEIRKRMNSKVLRCTVLKDGKWQKGSTIGIREMDSEKYIKNKILKIEDGNNI